MLDFFETKKRRKNYEQIASRLQLRIRSEVPFKNLIHPSRTVPPYRAHEPLQFSHFDHMKTRSTKHGKEGLACLGTGTNVPSLKTNSLIQTWGGTGARIPVVFCCPF